jgi:hypothetical protein
MCFKNQNLRTLQEIIFYGKFCEKFMKLRSTIWITNDFGGGNILALAKHSIIKIFVNKLTKFMFNYCFMIRKIIFQVTRTNIKI